MPWIAATSTEPARPAPRPPRKVATTISRATGSPFSSAARTLPPTMRAAKPKVVRFMSNQAMRQAMRPKPSPQCTSSPGRLPSMLSSPIGSVDGLLRLAGSRSGPSTMWLRSAMAM